MRPTSFRPGHLSRSLARLSQKQPRGRVYRNRPGGNPRRRKAVSKIGQIRVGTSGWRYPPWRGAFYPSGLPQRRELEHLSRQMNAVEINGSFYSLQRPERYLAWHTETPAGFLFAVKGGRFITHLKQLRDVETALANFYASGVLALADKLGPFLWQLPPRLAFDPDRVSTFLGQLPRTTREAVALGKKHDDKLKSPPFLKPGPDRPVRHALEVRHPSFTTPEALDLLKKHRVALVTSDAAAPWPYREDQTTDFSYVRLHGSDELYTSNYSDSALREWAAKITEWHDGGRRDVHVYFDNDSKVAAPHNAVALTRLLDLPTQTDPAQ